ncbi:MAG TPA: site-specific integrase [Pyrinomonadaceae bacterium]|jgi:integrase|nr:site-specific integrase [Pyrinomonadaceae bacterium]
MAVKKALSKRHGREVWGYVTKIDGKRRRRFGFSSEEAARLAESKALINAFERKHGVAPPPAAPTVTIKQLVAARSAQLQGTKRRKTSARLLERWLETLPAGLLVTQVTTALLQEWVTARTKEVSEETIFREVTDICSCLNRAGELFSALETWQPPRRPRMKTPTRRRDRLISKDEARIYLAHLRRSHEEGETELYWSVRGDAADLLQIALLTTARRMEILSLRWSDVNFEWKNLRVTDEKTGKVKNIPMAGALTTLLLRRKAASGASPLVFPAMEGKTMLRANTDQIYRLACAQLGMPYGRDVPGGWVLHDARHTAITAMLHAGHSLESVMAISGHSARVMAMRYAHSTEATRRAAVTALDQFGDEKCDPFLAREPRASRQTRPPRAPTRESKGKKTVAKSKKSVKTRSARA